MYGVITAALMAVWGVLEHERALLVAAGFAGLTIAGAGFVLNWARTTQNVWLRANAHWLIVGGVLANILLLVLDLLFRK
jgi:hypothetical protein